MFQIGNAWRGWGALALLSEIKKWSFLPLVIVQLNLNYQKRRSPWLKPPRSKLYMKVFLLFQLKVAITEPFSRLLECSTDSSYKDIDGVQTANLQQHCEGVAETSPFL